jgi:hypothetical protein
MTAKTSAGVCGERGSAQALLRRLETQALRYFIENQLQHGLVLDRQRNFGRRKFTGLCSLSATGMGLIALALASAPEHRLLTRAQSRHRIKKALRTALQLPHIDGMLQHFVDARTLEPQGTDVIATVDASWLFAGALWAAEYFAEDAELHALAQRLWNRVDWRKWGNGAEAPLIHHGADVSGNKLASVWDRYNAETAFMYVLAIGAEGKKALPARSWDALDLAFGCLGKHCFISADLGLFVFQYSLALIDGCALPPVKEHSLLEECVKGIRANQAFCVEHRGRYRTFQTFWGLSAGDGPCTAPCVDAYRAYSPHETDGTAHITATLASVDLMPELVLPNILAAEQPQWRHLNGRYGYSNVNIDHNFVSRDVVGIDVGAAFMALENALHNERVRKIFMRLQPVRRALRRIARSQKGRST